ncbi:signal recognition particle-docking protein FtsY [Salinibius halmophilus]|uniref:signal recognition particle-docking protein FtsY n=1 Tax=Salinibius halmophilus TaxID=1853216 RepID=UPI000E66EB63|nr:signal recognition particle-docking protein FtsY [Salinibius halmophilus]
MFGFGKKKKLANQQASDEAKAVESVVNEETSSPTPEEAVTEQPKRSFFGRIKDGLSRTRSGLTESVATLFLGKKEIDDELLEELETQLLMADVGMEATNKIISDLTAQVSRKELADGDALYKALQKSLGEVLTPVSVPLEVPNDHEGPFVILVVGINGVGKTTTIGKLAKYFQAQGKSVMLAAGDTYRAAAVEQLKVWGERNKVDVVAQHTGADSASVIFDAVQAAQSRGVDVVLADTAGRLHNKDNLMNELEKVVRVMRKLAPTAPHETLLVLDAGTGQNAINQTQVFKEAVDVSGMVLTKLDGTAKGGILFALADKFNVPIRFIGVGEQIDDLRPFDGEQFISALFDTEKEAD